jgi:hypothetical protein
VQQLAAANTFTGNQTVNGNLSATGIVSGNSYNIGSNLFAFGSLGSLNAFLGFAGNSTTTGVEVTAAGPLALGANTTGGFNTAFGTGALFANTSGSNNSAGGTAALANNSTGSSNTAFGDGAGNPLDTTALTGSSNTFLGTLSLPKTGTLNNATAIGAQAEVDASNSMVLGSIQGINSAQASTNVGIGTTTPAAQLDVEGNAPGGTAPILELKNNAAIQSGATGNSIDIRFSSDFGSQAGTPDAYIRVQEDGNGKYSSFMSFATITEPADLLERMRIASNGNVGIGTTTPGAPLEVDGSDQLDVFIKAPQSGVGAGLDLFTTGSGGLQWEILNTGTGAAQGANKLNFRNVNSGNDIMTILASGEIGIETSNPDNTLTVNGSADKPGGGSWGTFSDRRLKRLDGSFSAGLSQILKINPVRYRYKEENALGIRDHDEHIGLVAQEVQKVIPEAVTENTKGYLLVNNDPILWAMLNAIKEQQAMIAKQQAQIRVQQAQIASLTRQVKTIKAGLEERGPARQMKTYLTCATGQHVVPAVCGLRERRP